MFSIVIPIYNEAQNIKTLIEEIFESLKNYNNFELVLVNDGSKDNTIEVVNNLKKIFKINLFNNLENQGQSFSIKKGIEESKYKTIITIDGDGQNNPNDIPKLLEKYMLNPEIYLIGGIRKKRKDSLVKIISSKIANKIRSKILEDGCEDTGCSLKIFDKNIFLKFPYFDGIHRFLPALYKGFGYNTFFMYVDHRPRIKGYSKYGTIDRLYRGIFDIIKVKKIIQNQQKIN